MGAEPHTYAAGGGRAPIAPELQRSRRFSLMFSPGDDHDIRAIAEGWDVPRATAAWALVQIELSRVRGRAMLSTGPVSLAISSAVDLLRANGYSVSRRNE